MGFVDPWELPDDYQIERYIQKLDQVATSMEAKWGVGTLETKVSAALREKWERQRDKLNDAIERRNLSDVARHVDATIKGWAALETEALKANMLRSPLEFWEVISPRGNLYRIVRNSADASAVASLKDKDARVWSIQEVARVLDHNDLVTVQEVKKYFPDSTLKNINKDFDFGCGDEIPF